MKTLDRRTVLQLMEPVVHKVFVSEADALAVADVLEARISIEIKKQMAQILLDFIKKGLSFEEFQKRILEL